MLMDFPIHTMNKTQNRAIFPSMIQHVNKDLDKNVYFS